MRAHHLRQYADVVVLRCGRHGSRSARHRAEILGMPWRSPAESSPNQLFAQRPVPRNPAPRRAM
ncbi:hypothetical protein F2981_32910 (plasmid) [Sinorhizobium meliloti]|nr:hypothetical protein [Sinorhizobium meliloti]